MVARSARRRDVMSAVNPALLALFLGMGCGDASDPSPPPSDPPSVPVSAVGRVVTTEERVGEEETYRLYRFSVRLPEAQLGISDLRFQKTLPTLLREKNAELVVNGGFWDRDRRPEGLAVSRSEELYPYDRDLGGGILAIRNGRAELLDGESAPPSGADFAVQARPRLVVDRQRNIATDDGKRADRTALCIRDRGETLEVIIARGEGEDRKDGPTLYQFADRLVRAGCEGALNLDGGSSTGAAWREDGQVRSLEPRTRLRLAVVIGSASPPEAR
ncbi:MAG: phosphodiester glycosidase family protein [Myxococcota bacterium]